LELGIFSKEAPVVTPDLLNKLRAAHREWHDTRGQSVESWLALMAEDVSLRSVADGAPGMAFSAPRKGLADARGYFSALHAEWEMLFHRADHFVVDGGHVVVIGACSWRFRPTGKVVETPIVQHWQFRDGLAVEYFEYYDTAKALDATRPDGAGG
jgi:ketosteroid isomerase-like protein